MERADAVVDGQGMGAEMRDVGHAEGLERAVELFAVLYADHPDYQQEWRPDR